MLTEEIRATWPQLPILILSMHNASLFADRAIRAGANGYLMKSDAAEHIFRAIRTIARKEIYLPQNVNGTHQPQRNGD